MGDPYGFLKTPKRTVPRRPVELRLQDWREIYESADAPLVRDQASRCMDCGVPFCHAGCPLGNLIPEWNDLVYRNEWRVAIDRLHATNNFPEFTGRLCPAPCEPACVLSINAEPVTIKTVEQAIVDRAWDEGWITPMPSAQRSGRRVAIVGSGPAGLAAGQQLTRAGHDVVVFERDQRIGGLLRYGIPEFKMEKRHIDRRIAQMEAEGTTFRSGVNVGVDLTIDELRAEFDAVVIAIGALAPRDLQIPGREFEGVHYAMDYLVPANQVCEGTLESTPIDAAGKHVVIIGGGDTGADCLGTAHRQGAASVTSLMIHARPPEVRPDQTPWPAWPYIFRVSGAHEEGGERLFAISTEHFVGDEQGHVRGLHVTDIVEKGHRQYEKVPGSERVLPCDLALLAIGYTGPEQTPFLDQLGVALDAKGNVARDAEWRSSIPGVYVAGDAGRGQSIIVWAIAEGRSVAAAVDRDLSGDTRLPAPVVPTSQSL